MTLQRKEPRDFVFVDELRDADENWPEYFFSRKVWVYMDEYRAELIGDEDYARILIYVSATKGWQYSNPLKDRAKTHSVLSSLQSPISIQQLVALGFKPWHEE